MRTRFLSTRLLKGAHVLGADRLQRVTSMKQVRIFLPLATLIFGLTVSYYPGLTHAQTIDALSPQVTVFLCTTLRMRPQSKEGQKIGLSQIWRTRVFKVPALHLPARALVSSGSAARIRLYRASAGAPIERRRAARLNGSASTRVCASVFDHSRSIKLGSRPSLSPARITSGETDAGSCGSLAALRDAPSNEHWRFRSNRVLLGRSNSN
jgi:hypothetical protein